jgi:ankyrin repeat protein
MDAVRHAIKLSKKPEVKSEVKDAVLRLIENTPEDMPLDVNSIKALIVQGAEINAINEHNKTALMLAAARGDMSAVVALLAIPGVTLNQLKESKNNALMLAAFNGHLEIVSVLLATPGILINQQGRFGFTALIMASRAGHLAIVNALLAVSDILVNLVDNDGNSALKIAIDFDKVDIAITLLGARGIQISNLRSNSKETALTLAATEGRTAVVKKLISMPCIDELINEPEGILGDTPLMCAARNSHIGVIRILLTVPKINIQLTNNNGFIATALADREGHYDIVRIIQEHEAAILEERNKKSQELIVKYRSMSLCYLPLKESVELRVGVPELPLTRAPKPNHKRNKSF